MTNEDIVRNASDVIWNKGDIFRIAEFYSENIRADYPVTDWEDGLDGVKKLLEEINEAIPDYHEQIDELISAGDRVIVRLTISGTHKGTMFGIPPTGKFIKFNEISIVQFEGGKIVEQRGVTDYLSVWVQLGLIELPVAGS